MEELNLNKKYLVFKESFARYFIVTGGRGSGKSFAVNSILLLLTYQAGHTILFTRFTLRAASISIIPEFIEKLEILNLILKRLKTIRYPIYMFKKNSLVGMMMELNHNYLMNELLKIGEFKNNNLICTFVCISIIKNVNGGLKKL